MCLLCSRCHRGFSSGSGLTRHQMYSTRCKLNMHRDITNNLAQKPRTLPYGFDEGSGPFPISDSVEPPNYVYPDYEPDDIETYGENSQDVHNTVLIHPDEIDERGGTIYSMSLCYNSDIPKLKENKYYPWINKHEFWITEWVLTTANISHKAANALLRYMHEHVRETTNIRIRNVRDIYQLISKASWSALKWRQINIVGITATPDTPQVYCRNVLEVIKSLFGNPMFCGEMHFRAERVFDENGKRLYNEIWTSDWWWEIQSKLPSGSTVIPIMLNSDATHLDILGRQKVHPMYITIGNIPKKIRRKSSRHAILLLGYLPILMCTPQERKQRIFKEAKYQIFHHGIKVILEQLIPIAKTGMMIPGPDGKIRCCFPILASYSVDYPEACMICRIKQGLCVRCNVSKDSLHDLTTTWSGRRSNDTSKYFRDYGSMLDKEPCLSSDESELSSDIEEENILNRDDNTYQSDEDGSVLDYESDTTPAQDKQNRDNDNVDHMIVTIDTNDYHIYHNMPNTLWDWNLTDIHQCMTPDKLHEIDKGIFCHLLNWFTMMVKEHYGSAGLQEIDWRFDAIPSFTGLQHFPRGITGSSALNAKDYRQIGKVILPIVTELLPDAAPVATFYHFLQWWYLIGKTSHSEDTIAEVKSQLTAFSKYVEVFKQYSKTSFNFPKFHSMVHYISFITSRGSMDNFTTEHFEHQHILDVKIPFRHSNKKTPIIQMLSWISQRDIVIQKREYLRLQDHDPKTSHDILEEDSAHNRLGSPRKPEEFLNIDEVERQYNFRCLHLSIQSWVHNYLQDGIGKNGTLKRVKRSRLPKLLNANVSNL
jgi:hypothetical protein